MKQEKKQEKESWDSFSSIYFATSDRNIICIYDISTSTVDSG
jgi:hypothetical protein